MEGLSCAGRLKQRAPKTAYGNVFNHAGDEFPVHLFRGNEGNITAVGAPTSLRVVGIFPTTNGNVFLTYVS